MNNRLLTAAEFWARYDRGEDTYRPRPEAKGISARSPGALPKQLDLTRFYSTSLKEDRLSALPEGLQTFGDVTFDARGMTELFSRNQVSGEQGPPAVLAIPVRQKARILHALQTVAWKTADKTVVARYIVHYADGETREIPMVYGDDVRDWTDGTAGEPTPKARKVWGDKNNGLQVFLRTYENPLPEVEIESIDIVSEGIVAPIILAITLEQ